MYKWRVSHNCVNCRVILKQLMNIIPNEEFSLQDLKVTHPYSLTGKIDSCIEIFLNTSPLNSVSMSFARMGMNDRNICRKAFCLDPFMVRTSKNHGRNYGFRQISLLTPCVLRFSVYMDTPTNFLITPGTSDGHMSNEALQDNRD